MILYLHDNLTTFKYKGVSVKYVATIDPKYLIWLHNSKFNIILSPEVLKYVGIWTNYQYVKKKK